MDAYGRNQQFYGASKKDVDVAIADTGTKAGILTAKSIYHTVYVQRIFVSVIVDAAQTLQFQDNAGAPVVIAKTKASPGLGPMQVIDFGPEGRALTQGKNLDAVISGAGLAAAIHAEGFQKVTGVPGVGGIGTPNVP